MIGVPSEETGEAVKAFVVPATGVTPGSGELSRSTPRPGWPASSAPVEIEVVDHLPHSVTGKVAKGRLREADR